MQKRVLAAIAALLVLSSFPANAAGRGWSGGRLIAEIPFTSMSQIASSKTQSTVLFATTSQTTNSVTAYVGKLVNKSFSFSSTDGLEAPNDPGLALQLATSPVTAISDDGRKGVLVWLEANGTSFSLLARSADLSKNESKWSGLSKLSTSAYGFWPELSLSRDGSRAVVVWTEVVDSHFEIWSSLGSSTGSTFSWSAPILVTSSADFTSYPQLALSGDGSNAVVSWSLWNPSVRTYELFFSELNVAASPSSWSTPMLLGAGYKQFVALSASGDVAAVISRSSELQAVNIVMGTKLGGVWTWGASTQLRGASNQFLDVSISDDGSKVLASWTFFGVLPIGLSYQNFEAVVGTRSGISWEWGPTQVFFSAINPDAGNFQAALSRAGNSAVAIWTNSKGVWTSLGTNKAGNIVWDNPAFLDQRLAWYSTPKGAFVSSGGAEATVFWFDEGGPRVARFG